MYVCMYVCMISPTPSRPEVYVYMCVRKFVCLYVCIYNNILSEIKNILFVHIIVCMLISQYKYFECTYVWLYIYDVLYSYIHQRILSSPGPRMSSRAVAQRMSDPSSMWWWYWWGDSLLLFVWLSNYIVYVSMHVQCILN